MVGFMETLSAMKVTVLSEDNEAEGDARRGYEDDLAYESIGLDDPVKMYLKEIGKIQLLTP